jgi:hypothetical protein
MRITTPNVGQNIHVAYLDATNQVEVVSIKYGFEKVNGLEVVYFSEIDEAIQYAQFCNNSDYRQDKLPAPNAGIMYFSQTIR